MTAPNLRVVRGDPTPEELAALTAVVAAAGAAEPPAPERVRRGGWSDPARQLRRPLFAGPNGWRASVH
ncbi:MAG TPA: acyl-CoA carboxylase subunit epsilon [Jatrophihabitans sp.]|nr:acyl-CoA carboxylase subunit epsilon [Jatrophihabitans sp.]